MAHTNYFLDPSYWVVSSGNLQTNGLLGLPTPAYIFNPSTINSNGFNKSSANLTLAQVDAYKTTLNPPDAIIPNASDFSLANWTALGWGSTPADVLNNYNTFITNNFIDSTQKLAINPGFQDVTTYIISGTIGGASYFLPFLGWANQTGSTKKFQLRWKGGYPYGFTGVNRIWDMTFTEGSSLILVECRQIAAKNSSGTGNAIWTKSSTAFLTGSPTPNNSDAFNINCATSSPVFTSTTISSDPGDNAFTIVYNSSNSDESNYTIDTGITFNFCGTNYTRIGVSSNSYVIFGSQSTTFSFPSYVFQSSSPSFPGIGLCADPTSSADSNVTFVGYRIF
jgi:hypothetical protein